MSEHETEKETAAASAMPEGKPGVSHTINGVTRKNLSSLPGICLSLAIGVLASGVGIARLLENRQLWSWDSGLLLIGVITIFYVIFGLVGPGSKEVRDKRLVAGWWFSDAAALWTIWTNEFPWIKEITYLLWISSIFCYLVARMARNAGNTKTPKDQASADGKILSEDSDSTEAEDA